MPRASCKREGDHGKRGGGRRNGLSAVEGSSFDLRKKLPPEGWLPDLIEFEDLIEDEDFVAATLHVAQCARGHCGIVLKRIERLLAANQHYALEILRILTGCREDLRAARRSHPENRT